MPEERIQKVLAAAGVASRRAAEALVSAGRVRVDGRRAEIGMKVDPTVSTIQVDGTPVGVGAARAYVALHKPSGVTSTTRDPHAESTVLDYVPTALVPDGTRLYPVGRLDQDSEGLILLTNDGDWAERVLHPRYGVEREYAVALAAPLTGDQARVLNEGIRLDEGLARLAGPLRTAAHRDTDALVVSSHPHAGLEAPAPAHVRRDRRADRPARPRADRAYLARHAALWECPDAAGTGDRGDGRRPRGRAPEARRVP